MAIAKQRRLHFVCPTCDRGVYVYVPDDAVGKVKTWCTGKHLKATPMVRVTRIVKR